MAGAPLEQALAEATAVQAARAALAGRRAWIVGGAVRDAYLGREVSDLDLAVAAGEEKEAARAIAAAAGTHVFQLSDRFPTWRAVARDGSWQADVSALRSETIEEDLGARDFTVNAVAVPLAGGEPIDPLGGLADLEAARLRAVSDRAFAEDPLRLLRAARIGAALGLEPDTGTLELARASAALAAEPAGERTFAELRGILAGPDPLGGLALIDEIGVTAAVLPELDALRGVAQNPNHHLDVHGHTLEVMRELLAVESDLDRYAGDRAAELRAYLEQPLADDLTRGGALRFAALFHDMGKPATRGERDGFITFIGHDSAGAEIVAEICRRLRTSNRLSAHLQAITEHHLRLGFLVRQRPLDRATVYEYLSATDPVSADVTLLSVADRLSARGSGPIASPEMVEAHLELAREMLGAALDWRRSPPRSPIGGKELAAELGIESGPRIGELLEQLRAAAYSGQVSSREEALELARKAAR